jgi:hypothetical protein
VRNLVVSAPLGEKMILAGVTRRSVLDLVEQNLKRGRADG